MRAGARVAKPGGGTHALMVRGGVYLPLHGRDVLWEMDIPQQVDLDAT